MLQLRDMVRKDGGGPLMKVVGIDRDEAECVWFDSRGTVHCRRFDLDHLTPFWLSTGPKSLWPEINDIADPAATADRQKRTSTRPKQSNKVKRAA